MTAVTSAEAIAIDLSVEELLTVLNALGATTIPGLETDAWSRLTPEQQDLALSVARRALEARGLARVDEKGELLVHRGLLTAVGVCAFPQRTAMIDRWLAGGEASRLFAHTRDAESVVHTVDGAVHRFVILSSETELFNHLAQVCGWDGPSPATPMELTLSRQVFTRVCDASAGGEQAAAQREVAAAAGPGEAGAALVRALSSDPRITVAEVVRWDGGVAAEQTFTVIEGAGQTWLVAPVDSSADAPLRVRTGSRADISAMLRGQ